MPNGSDFINPASAHFPRGHWYKNYPPNFIPMPKNLCGSSAGDWQQYCKFKDIEMILRACEAGYTGIRKIVFGFSSESTWAGYTKDSLGSVPLCRHFSSPT